MQGLLLVAKALQAQLKALDESEDAQAASPEPRTTETWIKFALRICEVANCLEFCLVGWSRGGGLT